MESFVEKSPYHITFVVNETWRKSLAKQPKTVPADRYVPVWSRLCFPFTTSVICLICPKVWFANIYTTLKKKKILYWECTRGQRLMYKKTKGNDNHTCIYATTI